MRVVRMCVGRLVRRDQLVSSNKGTSDQKRPRKRTVGILARTCGALALLGVPSVAWAQPVSAPWFENFDFYNAPDRLTSQGNWEPWNGLPLFEAFVVTAPLPKRSDPNSVKIDTAATVIQQFDNVNSGPWVLTGYWYVPREHCCTETYILVLNEYQHGGPYSWSVKVGADGLNGVVRAYNSGEELTLITNQWVEVRLEIDFDANWPNGRQDFYYGGQLLYSGPWIGQVSPAGSLAFAALELWANASSPVYFDDLSLVSTGCAGDLDGDGQRH